MIYLAIAAALVALYVVIDQVSWWKARRCVGRMIERGIVHMTPAGIDAMVVEKQVTEAEAAELRRKWEEAGHGNRVYARCPAGGYYPGEAEPGFHCCGRAGEYNGFGGPDRLFDCPRGCSCHD